MNKCVLRSTYTKEMSSKINSPVSRINSEITVSLFRKQFSIKDIFTVVFAMTF